MALFLCHRFCLLAVGKGDVHGRIGFARDSEDVGKIDRAEGLSHMKPFAKSFYTSIQWKNTREAYKASVGGLCEVCWAKGIVTPGEIVHHKIPLTQENITDESIALGWDNLQLVCRQCHADIHESREKRYTVDEWGHVIAR